ncbi:MAG: HEAT repeat domain-containing protein [Planctomycetota bacterium]
MPWQSDPDPRVERMVDAEDLVDSRLARRDLVARGHASVTLLAGSLSSENRWWARHEILAVLSEIGDPAATPVFESSLADPAHLVRAIAVAALSRNGLSLIEPHLEALVHDPAWTVRKEVAVGCGRDTTARSAEILELLATDPDVEVQRFALLSLDRRRDPEADAAVLRLLEDPENRRSVARWIRPGERPALMMRFSELLFEIDDLKLAVPIAAAIARAPASKALPERHLSRMSQTLLEGLATPAFEVSHVAKAALRLLGAAVIGDLRQLLSRADDPTTHRLVWELLVELRPGDLIPFLQEHIESSAPNRSLALDALGRVAGPEILSWLETLYRQESDSAARQAILAAGVRIGTEASIPLLELALEDSSFRTRYQAADRLTALQVDTTLGALLDSIRRESPRQQSQFVRLLRQWPVRPVAELLLELAEFEGYAPLSRGAIEALGSFDEPWAKELIVPRLEAMLEPRPPADESTGEEIAAEQRTRVVLVRSLGQILQPEGRALLLAMYERGAEEDDIELLKAVLGSIARRGAPWAREALQAALVDPRLREERGLLREVARHLVELGDPAGAEFLIEQVLSVDRFDRSTLIPELVDIDRDELVQYVASEIERSSQEEDLDPDYIQGLIEYALSKRSPLLIEPLLELARRSGAPTFFRASAIEALGETHEPRVESPLIALAHGAIDRLDGGSWSEEDAILLRRVFEALGKVGSVHCVPLLAESLLVETKSHIDSEVWSYYQDPDRPHPKSRFGWEESITRALARLPEDRVVSALEDVLSEAEADGSLFQLNDDLVVFVGRSLIERGGPAVRSHAERWLELSTRLSPTPSPADFEALYWRTQLALDERRYTDAATFLERAEDMLWTEVVGSDEARVRIDLRVALLEPKVYLESLIRVAKLLAEPESPARRASLERGIRESYSPDAELMIQLADLLLRHDFIDGLAEDMLTRAEQVEGARSDLSWTRARLAAARADWPLAAEQLADAITTSRRDGLVPTDMLSVSLARILVKMERIAEAREALSVAIAIDSRWRSRLQSDPSLSSLLDDGD